VSDAAEVACSGVSAGDFDGTAFSSPLAGLNAAITITEAAMKAHRQRKPECA
jgi:hypothetical protein